MNKNILQNLRGTLRRAIAIKAGLMMALVLWTCAAFAQTRVAHAQLSAAVVDEQARVQLHGAEPLLSRIAVDQGRLSAGEKLEGMKLVLRRGAAEQSALQQFLDDVQRPGSDVYRKWLTPQQFGELYGASDADVATVSGWLRQHGFTVDAVSKSRMVITFTGSEAQFESAFHAEMHHYQLNGESRVANSSTPSVPVALAPSIFGVATLGNATHRPMHTKPQAAKLNSDGQWRMQSDGLTAAAKVGAPAPQFTTKINGNYVTVIGPADFGEIYNVKPLWDKGVKGDDQSIAIVAESNIAKSDVDAFRKSFGLPETKLNVFVVGADPGLDSSGSEGEAALDVQWAGGIAPNATVNLIVASSTKTQFGIAIAAEYAIENNLSPVMDISWGACEMGLQASGNQYWTELWAQAAAQGISVMVASGDAGSVACDQNQYFSNYGQQVSGIASTEYATAVGGTDLYGNTEGAGKYWSSKNDPTTLQSAKSYITESTWNDSCANPLVLQHAADFGLSETTSEAICSNEFSLLNTVGGGGGVSNCTTSDGASQKSCQDGHDAPLWQYGFAGMDASSKRHVPDVSFFSGAGLWGAAYAMCEADASDATYCQNQNGDMSVLTGGGTSFAAPAFAGVVALLNQQQGGRLGNINKYLYSLAAKQFADPTLAANCVSGSGADISACIFHDVVAGSIAEPCRNGTVVDPVTGALCSSADATSYYGITPGYDAVVGYDMATGLGSINVANLASNWGSAVANDKPITVTHALDVNQVTYGANATATINVQGGSAIATGAVSLMSTEADGSTIVAAAGWLDKGVATLTFNGLSAGAHQLYAVYGGDASYGSSRSTATTFTVARTATTLSPTASVTAVIAPNTSTVLVSVQNTSFALNPSGSLVFTNKATGAAIGVAKLSRYIDPVSGASWSRASYKLTSAQLQSGDNVIAINYAGDGDFLPAAEQTVSISYKPYYAVSASNATLDVNMGQGGRATATIVIASNAGAKVDASSLALACDSIAVNGLSCSFGSPVANADGSVAYPLTLVANNPQPVTTSASTNSKRMTSKGAALLIFACAAFFVAGNKRRNKWTRRALPFVAFCALALLAACGGGSHAKSSPVVNNGLSVSASSVAYGAPVTMTSTLSPVSNVAQPSGTVLFYDGANLLGSAPVSDGKASLTVSTLSIGAHSLTASYSGDTTFMPSSSTASSVSVALSAAIRVNVRDTAGNASTLSLPVTIH